MISPGERIRSHLNEGGQVSLFLDYDGTLADFAPTPDIVVPDPQLIALLERLASRPSLRLAIISGRRLEHVRALVPLAGIWLAGSYGLELQTPAGEQLERLDFSTVRPTLEAIKPVWQALLGDLQGFYLEDKGWTLAIHAKNAETDQADRAIQAALEAAKAQTIAADFKLLGGHRFLEISPKLADKGQIVDYLLKTDLGQGTLPVYIGDDDKDIQAFPVVQSHAGLALLVGVAHQAPEANGRLGSPGQVRSWLADTFL